MEKILITGGAGFIGSYITRKLVEAGHEVVIYDAFIQYISPLNSQYQYFFACRFNDIKDRIKLIRADTRDARDIARVVREEQPDRVIHLAALPIADLAYKNSNEAIQSIINGTVNVLDAIVDADCVKRFTYTSSSMVYGDFVYEPADEEHPKMPKEVYGGAKYAGEILTETYSRRYGIDYTIIRPSAVYGPMDANRRVSQIFVENAKIGKDLVIHGDVYLDFSFVEDIAEGFLLATMSDAGKNEKFNITRGEARSLEDFANILKVYYPDIVIRKEEKFHYRPKRGALNISKAKEMLGYNPTHNLEKGIEKYVEFIESIDPQQNICKVIR